MGIASISTALTSNEKAALFAIDSAFSFSWGFVNATVYLLTGRFCTMMSGNTLILAIETSDWKSEEMMVTATLIILYVCGGAVYDALWISFKDKGRVVKLFVIPTIVIMGILADVLQYMMGGCSAGVHDGAKCSGKYLYFLSPVAFLSGVATSYSSTHGDGIATNMVTGHMKVMPTAILKRILQGESTTLEKGRSSAAITTFFFLGCLSGALAYDPILMSFSPRKGYYTPIFTVFSCVIAMLCFLHYSLCEQLFLSRELEQELVERMRTSLMQVNKSACSTDIEEGLRMMVATTEEEKVHPVSSRIPGRSNSMQ
eukprot:CAMPEP_0201881464 /NCGR_PEP_ID=MMETSP0902-20130614/11770_1 /ASSEMBLY_ACC=CAM_ASM_000551 /TAXON_ID=420261 /ORGANISM="Thalassiosira antarctica, Strain CCMP982" /LENGTH=313 /DNA_ID=CAMNT_0048409683 /DNA_START=37 /DNA_END=978 /DNA_ORIENTATION=+